jgi:hypothetical protein
MSFKFDFDNKTVNAVGVPTPTKKDTSHVRIIPPGLFFCLHCGGKYQMTLPVPINIMVASSNAFEKEHRRCKLRKEGIACMFCYGFGHEPFSCPKLDYGGDIDKWLEGPDTGSSSKTLCATLVGHPGGYHSDVPRDPSDFGRCYRFLKAFPHLRPRIGEMKTVQGWERIADAWDELEKLYEEEIPNKTCPKLYARLTELQPQRQRGDDP